MPSYIAAKKMITRTKYAEKWFGNDFNMNIYRGCTHGCIYCDSRSDCYHIGKFDEIQIKENALLLIEKELSGKRISGVIGTGAMSDPYNIYEKKLMLTQGALKLINKYKFGVGICTKGDLVTRDINLLTQINGHSPVTVCMTITSAHDEVSKVIEPGAPISSKRFEAVKGLNDAKIFTGILMMPLLLGITDTVENVRGILDKAIESGASFIYPAFGLTLRDGNRDYFYIKLDELYPGLKEEYIKAYGLNYICNVPDSVRLYNVFKNECEKNGIKYKMKDIIAASKSRVRTKQISLF